MWKHACVISVTMSLLLASRGMSADTSSEVNRPSRQQVAVTVNNVTKGQTFSPPVVIVHRRDFRLFELGRAPSEALALLAEEGESSLFIDQLDGERGIHHIVAADGPVPPGKSVTLTVSVTAAHRVSVFGKLLSTNDGFFAAQALRAPRTHLEAGERTVSFVRAFDAGTEVNTELCDHIPECGGPNVRRSRGSEGVVTEHRGIQGSGDLAPEVYGWKDPVAEVSVGADVSGSFEFPLGLSIPAPGELVLQEPSMCDGSATARVEFSRSENSVVIDVSYEGVPVGLSTSFPSDPSTAYNRFPPTVANGKWQTWIVGYFGGKPTTIWYDSSGRLIGTKYHLPEGGPPPGAFAVEAQAAHALCSDLWEPEVDGSAEVRIELAYDRLLDSRGTGGTVVFVAPYQFGDNSTLGIVHYGGVPASDAMSFDDVLNSIETREGFAIATTYEPAPKPDYLLSRSNNVTAWLGTYPRLVDPTPPTPCETTINAPWPAMSP